MTHATPLDPLVAKNMFREVTAVVPSITSYVEAKKKLPIPVVANQPEWIEMYWRAWELAWLHLKRPLNISGFLSVYLGSAHTEHQFMWDTAFMSQFLVYSRRVLEATGGLNNLYAKQKNDGFICREINEQGANMHPPFDPNSTGPNILGWAEWRLFRTTGDVERLKQVFWPLLALHRWCKAHRTWRNGLYWATGVSSGLTNQPRIPNGQTHHQHGIWVDACMQAVLNCQLLEKMARVLEEPTWAEELAQERVVLMSDINATLWDEEGRFYRDVEKNGRFASAKTVAAYWSLLDRDLIKPERLSPFVQNLRENWGFNLPHRIPALSADSDAYNPNGNEWRGGVASPTNYMVLKGLRHVEQHQLAHEIALNHLEQVCAVYIKTDTFWEHYAPEAPEPSKDARPDFVGWTGLTPISILFEDVIGIWTDWPQKKVYWDIRLEGAHGVQNYPLGRRGVLDMVLDEEGILRISTDTPFTLVMTGQETLQAAVPTGLTEIDLS